MDLRRGKQFDPAFRPAGSARRRWQRVWLAEHRGVPLPPISVIRIGDSYAVRDGHHRISVARARGALTIDATVEAVLARTRDARRGCLPQRATGAELRVVGRVA